MRASISSALTEEKPRPIVFGPKRRLEPNATRARASCIDEQVMPLASNLFQANQRLQECLIKDSAHVTSGSRGVHVALIQYAVLRLEGGQIDGRDIIAQLYGPTTAAAVLAYKTRRRIINTAYQTSADNIVGRLTIAALDREMRLVDLKDLSRNILPL
jgi:hypothetical protein